MSYFIMEDLSSSLRYVQPWNLVPSELEADWLPKVAAASRQDFPVRTCQRKLEVSVGMLTKLWADWVFGRVRAVIGGVIPINQPLTRSSNDTQRRSSSTTNGPTHSMASGTMEGCNLPDIHNATQQCSRSNGKLG